MVGPGNSILVNAYLDMLRSELQGKPFVNGYKPYPNIQASLRDRCP